MPRFTQVLSIGLLASRVTLVFDRLTRSVGFSLAGIVASLAVVLTFLYSGAVFVGTSRLLTQGKPTPFSYSIERFGWSASFNRGLPIRAILAGSPADLEFPMHRRR